MQERFTRFGDYLRQIRLADSREVTMQDVANALGVSKTYISEVENRRKAPLSGKHMEIFAEYFELNDEQRARMYDLASIENRAETIPYDIAGTLMYENVGDMARFALRQSKAGFITEADWKQLIRKSETRKAKMLSEQTEKDNGKDSGDGG